MKNRGNRNIVGGFRVIKIDGEEFRLRTTRRRRVSFYVPKGQGDIFPPRRSSLAPSLAPTVDPNYPEDPNKIGSISSEHEDPAGSQRRKRRLDEDSNPDKRPRNSDAEGVDLIAPEQYEEEAGSTSSEQESENEDEEEVGSRSSELDSERDEEGEESDSDSEPPIIPLEPKANFPSDVEDEEAGSISSEQESEDEDDEERSRHLPDSHPELSKKDDLYLEKTKKWTQLNRFLGKLQEIKTEELLRSNPILANPAPIVQDDEDEHYAHHKTPALQNFQLNLEEAKSIKHHILRLLASDNSSVRGWFTSLRDLDDENNSEQIAQTIADALLIKQIMSGDENSFQRSIDLVRNVNDCIGKTGRFLAGEEIVVDEDDDELVRRIADSQFLQAFLLSSICCHGQNQRFSISQGVIAKKYGIDGLSALATSSDFDFLSEMFDGEIKFSENCLFAAELKDVENRTKNPANWRDFDYSKPFDYFEEQSRKKLESKIALSDGWKTDESARLEHIDSLNHALVRANPFDGQIDILRSKLNSGGFRSDGVSAKIQKSALDFDSVGKVDLSGFCSVEYLGKGVVKEVWRSNENFEEFRKNADEEYEAQKIAMLKHNLMMLAYEEIYLAYEQLKSSQEAVRDSVHGSDVEDDDSASIQSSTDTVINESGIKYQNILATFGRMFCEELTIKERDSLSDVKEKQEALLGALPQSSFQQEELDGLDKLIGKLENLKNFCRTDHQSLDQKGLIHKFAEIFKEGDVSEDSASNRDSSSASSPVHDFLISDELKNKIEAAAQNAHKLAKLNVKKFEREKLSGKLRITIANTNTTNSESKYWQDKVDSWDKQFEGADANQQEIGVINYAKNSIEAFGKDKNLIIFDGKQRNNDYWFKSLGNKCFLKVICPSKDGYFKIHGSDGEIQRVFLRAGEVKIDAAVHIIDDPDKPNPKKPKIVSFGDKKTFAKRLGEGFKEFYQSPKEQDFLAIAKTVENKLKTNLKDFRVISMDEGRIVNFKKFSFERSGEIDDETSILESEQSSNHAGWKGFDDLQKLGIAKENIDHIKQQHYYLFDFNADQKGFLSLGKDENGEELLVGFKLNALKHSQDKCEINPDGLLFFKTTSDAEGNLILTETQTNQQNLEALAKANFFINLPDFLQENGQRNAQLNAGDSDVASNPRVIHFSQSNRNLHAKSPFNQLLIGREIKQKTALSRQVQVPCKPIAKGETYLATYATQNFSSNINHKRTKTPSNAPASPLSVRGLASINVANQQP